MDWKFYKGYLNNYEAKWKAGVLSDVEAAKEVLWLMSDLLAEAVDTAAIEEIPDLVLAVALLANLIEKKARN